MKNRELARALLEMRAYFDVQGLHQWAFVVFSASERLYGLKDDPPETNQEQPR